MHLKGFWCVVVCDNNFKLDRLLHYDNITRELGIVRDVLEGLQVIAFADASYGVPAD